MLLGGAEDIAIEGEACEKSKPRVLSIAVYCVIAVVAHFVAQDVGGCVALSLLGGLLYYYYRHPTHLSITLAIAISVATLLMTGLVWISVLMTMQMEIWLADTITKFEFTLYLIDCAASCIALMELLRVFDSPTSGGPRSFLPRWTSYGGSDREAPAWSPFQGPGQTLGAAPAEGFHGMEQGTSPTQRGPNQA